MNAIQVRGQWNQVRGGFMMGWARLTDSSLGRINGRMLKLVGKTQVKYGRVKGAAGKQLRKFTRH